MKMLFFSSLLAVVVTQAAGQVRPAPVVATRPALTLSFDPTTGIDKTFAFSNGMSATFSGPDVSVVDGEQQTAFTMAPNRFEKQRIVATRNHYLLVRHATNALEYFDYPLEGSDSVHFSYQRAGPVAAVTNRACRPYDCAFECHAKRRLQRSKFSPLTVFLNPNYFHDFAQKPDAHLTPEQRMSRLLLLNRGIRDKAYPAASALLRAEQHLLDSLRERQLVSEGPYQFYANKLACLQTVLDVQTGRLTADQAAHQLAVALPPPGYPAVYRQQLLEAVTDSYLTEKVPFLDLKDGVNRDYRQVYAQLRTSSLFAAQDRAYVLTRELDRIGKAFPRADFLAFFKQYTQDVTDTALVAQVKARYALEFDDSRSAVKAVVLTDAHGWKLTLSELLQRHAGKVIYIDFWASWCAPCREALPHARQLRESLQDKGVVVLYLSIDKLPQPWLAASSQEKLADYPENYLIVNYQTAEFFRQQQLTAIPRYMILDKQGRLVQANAPSAESTQLVSVLLGLAR